MSHRIGPTTTKSNAPDQRGDIQPGSATDGRPTNASAIKVVRSRPQTRGPVSSERRGGRILDAQLVMGEQVQELPTRGLPGRHQATRGCSRSWIDISCASIPCQRVRREPESTIEGNGRQEGTKPYSCTRWKTSNRRRDRCADARKSDGESSLGPSRPIKCHAYNPHRENCITLAYVTDLVEKTDSVDGTDGTLRDGERCRNSFVYQARRKLDPQQRHYIPRA